MPEPPALGELSTDGLRGSPIPNSSQALSHAGKKSSLSFLLPQMSLWAALSFSILPLALAIRRIQAVKSPLAFFRSSESLEAVASPKILTQVSHLLGWKSLST